MLRDIGTATSGPERNKPPGSAATAVSAAMASAGKGRAAGAVTLRRPWKKTLAARYSPAADCRSTLATGALHFRVRNGNGCCLPAMATKEKTRKTSWFCAAAFRSRSRQPSREHGSEAKWERKSTSLTDD